jgi:zinc transporter ZupT
MVIPVSFSSAQGVLILSALIAIGLALAHLYSGRLRFKKIPRSRWLSAAGGVSVAYVFVHILPELSQHQTVLQDLGKGIIPYIEHHVYLIALLGLTIFYGLERLAMSSRNQLQRQGQGDITSRSIFWLHIISFAIYNALIGYLLLHREEQDITSLLLFGIAMTLHFVVNDNGLREHHKHLYDRIGRWILAAAIIVGWVLGSGTEIQASAIAVLFAFLAGGVVLNVLKEELPEERESCFWAFVLGAAAYTILLLAL